MRRGTSWSHVNLKFPSAAKKVMRHVKLMKKLWKAIEQFIELMSRSFDIAIGWLQNCPYWRLPRIVRLMNKHSLQPYSFHGCMLGVVDHEGTPIKKHWAVATSMHEIGLELSCPSINATSHISMCNGGENHSKKLRVIHFGSLTVCT